MEYINPKYVISKFIILVSHIPVDGLTNRNILSILIKFYIKKIKDLQVASLETKQLNYVIYIYFDV